MTEEIKQIADRIRGLRDINSISAEDVAKALYISVEEYLKYESGNVDIPIGFMYKIAHKFGVELSALLTGDNPKLNIYNLVRKDKGIIIERRQQYKYESLAFNFTRKKMEPFLVTVGPETLGKPIQFGSHPGQEFDYVIEGSVVLLIEDHELVLNEGDAVYFDSSFNHAMKAVNNQPARFIAVII
jgi:transcriptional regulator with XRE-family HTH domain